jgi:CheY-like chemotaxis protein
MNKEKMLLIVDDLDNAELVISSLGIDDIIEENVMMKNRQEAMDFFQKSYASWGNGIMSQIYLIILDINLSNVHGMEVLRFLKKNSKFSSIPIIIFLPSADTETIL